MTKVTLTNLVNLQNETTAVNAINDNSAAITTAVENTLSRDGTQPNQMGANLDMNSNRILNLPSPSSNDEPLRLIDAATLNGGGSITIPFSSIQTISVTTTKTLVSGDMLTKQMCSGNAFYLVNLPTTASVSAAAWVVICNTDVYTGSGTGRAKLIVSPDGNSWTLYPGMTVTCTPIGSNRWQFDGAKRWNAPAVSTSVVTYFCNYNTGVDALTTDGLSSAAPFKTAEYAMSIASNDINFDTHNQTQLVIQLAAGMNDAVGVHLPYHDLCGAQGGQAVRIQGASLAISGAVNNGSGLIRITVPSTATYSTNQVVSVYGVGGTTEANKIWKVTVIDGTHLDLQGSAFSHAYTSGGTITNGSGFSTSVDCVGTYFGTTVQLKDLLFTSSAGSGVTANWGSKIYLLDGLIFSTVAGQHIVSTNNSYIECEALYGISGAAAYHVVTSLGGVYSNASGVNFLTSVALGFTAFTLAAQGGVSNFQGPVNLNSATITGIRWQAQSGGAVLSATGAANTDLPGNSSGVVAGTASENTNPLSLNGGGTGTAGLGLKGTSTNDNAGAGIVGEYLSATGSIGLGTGVVSNVCTISITAGDWDVWATPAYFTGGATTTVTYLEMCISTTSATQTLNANSMLGAGATIFNTLSSVHTPIPPIRLSVTGATSVYLTALGVFGVSTATGNGTLIARRVR